MTERSVARRVPAHRLRRFLSLDGRERRLSLHALGVLAVLRIGLYVAPTPWLLRRVLGRPPAGRRGTSGASPEAVGRAVRRASRLVPRATCLPQAMAALWLLAGNGHRGTLRIGIKRGVAGELVGHAWVEHGSEIVVGGRGVSDYTVLPDLQGALWVPR